MNDKIQKEIEAREKGRLFECILNLNPMKFGLVGMRKLISVEHSKPYSL